MPRPSAVRGTCDTCDIHDSPAGAAMTAVDPRHTAPVERVADEQAQDALDLEQFGYQQELRRAISPLASLAVAFSMISVSTGVFALFAIPFTTVGGWGIWLWLPVAAGLM